MLRLTAMKVRSVVTAVLFAALAACGSDTTADLRADPVPSETSSSDECIEVEMIAYDVRVTDGAPSPEDAATEFAQSKAQRDARYQTEGSWRTVSRSGSDERQLRSGNVQVGVAQGVDGTWHLLGASLCRSA